ncbi:MAG: hypothetical protein ABIV51_08260 [Saprospiraceae bacterium]
MQSNNSQQFYFLLLGIFILLLPSSSLFSQTVQINAQGEKILVFGDGSWRHYMPGDSVYLAKTEVKDTFVVLQHDNVDPFEIPDKGIEPKRKSRLKPSKKIVDNNTPEDEYIVARKLRIEAEEKLRKLQKSESQKAKEEIPETITLIEERLDIEKKAKENYDLFKKTGQTPQKDAVEKAVEKSREPKMQGLEDAEETEAPRKAKSQKPAKKSSTSTVSTEPLSGLFPPSQILEKPAIYPCEVSKKMDGSRSVRETNVAVFFKYTDETLKSFLGNKDFIVCESNLKEKGSDVYLVLNFHLYTKSARQEYGHIQEGAMLILSPLQGQNVNLFNTISGSALYDDKNGVTHYQGIYAISKDQLKALAQLDIKAVRVVWSSGYEDYEVYNLDLIRSQISCLLQNQ